MKKYFKEEMEKVALSKYLEEAKEEFSLVEAKKDSYKRKAAIEKIAQIEYSIQVLGDVELERDMIGLFHKQFIRYTGRYIARTSSETLTDMYEIITRCPYLTKEAVSIIWDKYVVRDLLGKEEVILAVETLEKDDEAFEKYKKYLDEQAKIQKEAYKEEAKEADKLLDLYSPKFVSHVKYLIEKHQFKYDEVVKYLPDSELVKKDEEQFLELAKREKITFEVGTPISYKLMDALLIDEVLHEKTFEKYPETLMYYIRKEKETKEQATFTKTQFLGSLKKDKVKVKKIEA